VRYSFIIVFVSITFALFMRTYFKETPQPHFQATEWVKEHVKPHEWVGAIQSGTVGYFHDRTINLDGKVNPEALVARQEDRLIQYVIDKKIDYLVDWVGIADWIEHYPLLKANYTLLIKDQKNGTNGLAVIKRIENTTN